MKKNSEIKIDPNCITVLWPKSENGDCIIVYPLNKTIVARYDLSSQYNSKEVMKCSDVVFFSDLSKVNQDFIIEKTTENGEYKPMFVSKNQKAYRVLPTHSICPMRNVEEELVPLMHLRMDNRPIAVKFVDMISGNTYVLSGVSRNVESLKNDFEEQNEIRFMTRKDGHVWAEVSSFQAKMHLKTMDSEQVR